MTQIPSNFVTVVAFLQQDLEDLETRFRQEQEELQKRVHTLESENEQVDALSNDQLC